MARLVRPPGLRGATWAIGTPGSCSLAGGLRIAAAGALARAGTGSGARFRFGAYLTLTLVLLVAIVLLDRLDPELARALGTTRKIAGVHIEGPVDAATGPILYLGAALALATFLMLRQSGGQLWLAYSVLLLGAGLEESDWLFRIPFSPPCRTCSEHIFVNGLRLTGIKDLLDAALQPQAGPSTLVVPPAFILAVLLSGGLVFVALVVWAVRSAPSIDSKIVTLLALGAVLGGAAEILDQLHDVGLILGSVGGAARYAEEMLEFVAAICLALVALEGLTRVATAPASMRRVVMGAPARARPARTTVTRGTPTGPS